MHPRPVFDVIIFFIKNSIPLVVQRDAALALVRTSVVASHRRRPEGIVHTAALIACAENHVFSVQLVPAYGMGQNMVRDKQTVIVSCYILISAFQTAGIGADLHGIGKGHPVEGLVRHRHCTILISFVVHHSRDLHCRQVEPVGPSGDDVKLLLPRLPPGGQSIHIRRNSLTRLIGLAIPRPAAEGHALFRGVQIITGGGGKGSAGSYHDPDIVGTAADPSAVEVDLHHGQTCGACRLSILDFKDRAETGIHVLFAGRDTVPAAIRPIPSKYTLRRIP